MSDDDYDDYEDEGGDDVNIVAAVNDFLIGLSKAVANRKIDELSDFHENKFKVLSDRYYKDTQWPSLAAVQGIVESESDLFRELYLELRYRHYFNKLSPSVKDRAESYSLYTKLISLLQRDGSLDLPKEWVAAIVSEFAYQYTLFAALRCNVATLSEEDKQVLTSHADAWKFSEVKGLLSSCVQSSGIQAALAKGLLIPEGSRPHSALVSLGYFSLVGLATISTVICDYSTALQYLAPLQVETKDPFNDLPSCKATVCYYAGFSNMMLRKYAEASRLFSSGIVAVVSHRHPNKTKVNPLQKVGEKMLAFLSITRKFCPGLTVDDQVKKLLRENHSQAYKNRYGYDPEAASAAFNSGAPKFIIPSVPVYNAGAAAMWTERLQARQAQQLEIFLDSLRLKDTFTAHSYLKLYTSIDVQHLGHLLHPKTESKVSDSALSKVTVEKLLLFKKICHDSEEVQSKTTETGVKGGNDINFWVRGDIVVVDDAVPPRRDCHYFMKQISRLDGLIHRLDRLRMK